MFHKRGAAEESWVTLGAELSPGLVKQVGAGRTEGLCRGLGGEQFLEVRRGISVDALGKSYSQSWRKQEASGVSGGPE